MVVIDVVELKRRIKDINRQLILSGHPDLAGRLGVSLTLALEPEHLCENLLLALNDVDSLYLDSDLNVREDVRRAKECVEFHSDENDRGHSLEVGLRAFNVGTISDIAALNLLIKGLIVRLEYGGHPDLELGLFTAWRYTHSAGEFYGEMKLALINIQKTQAVEDVEIEQAVTNALEFVTSTLDIMNGKNLSTSPSA